MLKYSVFAVFAFFICAVSTAQAQIYELYVKQKCLSGL